MLVVEDGQPSRGSIDIRSWGRLLKEVKIALPGTSHETTLDMDAGNKSVTIRVPFDGGRTQLMEGTFTARNKRIKVDALDLPGSRFADYDGTAKLISIEADKQGVQFKIAEMPFQAKSASLRVGSSEAVSGRTQGTVKSIDATTSRAGLQLALTDLKIGAISTRGDDCQHSVRTAQIAAAESCAVTSVAADASRRRLKFEASATRSMIGTPVFGSAGAAQLTTVATLVGDPHEDFSGRFSDATSRLGLLEMSKQFIDVTTPLVANGRIEFPFSFSLPTSKGTWRTRLPQGKVAITGIVRTLAAKGTVGVALAEPNNWVVAIDQGDFKFDAGVETVVEPVLYDSKPQFGSVGLKFSAHTPVRVTSAGATGTLLAGADALLIADPVISLGDAKGSMVLMAPAKFDAGVELTYRLSDGRTDVETGRLVVENAKLVTKPGQPGDLGEVQLHEGSVGFERLDAKFSEGKGKATLSGLSLKAASLQSKPRASDSTAGNQLTWSGKPQGAITIASVEGRILKDEATRGLSLGDVFVTNLNASLQDVRLGQGKALRFAGGTLNVAVLEYGPQKFTGKLDLRNAQINSSTPNDHGMTHVSTAVESLAVNITGGTPAAPNGTAALQTRYLNLETDAQIEIRETCTGVPDFSGIPVHAIVKSGPVLMKLAMQGGSLSGRGEALVTTAQVKDRGKFKCEAKVVDWPVVKQQRAVYDYPCPTWSKPLRTCRGWTVTVPEVNVVFDRVIEVRSFQASGFFSAMGIHLKGGDKMEACGRGGYVSPLADVSYYVTPRTSIPIADKIFKEIIDQTSRPFTSALVSGAGTLYGSIMPLTRDGLCL